jgi:hypothetical protein
VPSSSWQFLNFVSNGAIITCYWFSNQSSCSSGGIFAGHIQFRYQRSTNWYYPHYTVGSVVNWNINFSDGLVYSISNGASGSCPWVGFYFRVAGNQLQIRNPLGFSPNVHLKVEAY